DKVNITRYSSRPGTAAAEMEQFPDRIKKDRSRVISRLVHKISREINLGYVGNHVEVLITDKGKKRHMVGRMDNYKPVICEGNIGEFKKVKIEGSTSTYLLANDHL
nr:TRAM domain-containing protein [Candidatus Methanofastidiosa archaeon]